MMLDNSSSIYIKVQKVLKLLDKFDLNYSSSFGTRVKMHYYVGRLELIDLRKQALKDCKVNI